MREIAIVGMKYIDEKFKMNPKLFIGEKIILNEEENNKYDKKAIGAYYYDDDDKLVKFGYVAKNQNDGTINTTSVYRIIGQAPSCIYIVEYEKKEDEEYYKRMNEEIDNWYIASCQHDKPQLDSSIFNVYNTREEDDGFDFMDNEEENDFWDTLFNDFFWD